MGQYQQWLHYQEIDRRLRTQLETLEAELAQLQEQLHLLEQQLEPATPLADNPIIQVLAAILNDHNVSPNSTTSYSNVSMTSSASDLQSPEPGKSISPELLSWGGLPNFGAQEIAEPFPTVEHTPPPVNHPEIELLPEDMLAFLDEYAQTDPQLELPWWLRNITISSKDEPGKRPIDQHSIRTNRLVQRWIERWGRQPPATLKPTEKQEEGARE
jgi:hypothetical protein